MPKSKRHHYIPRFYLEGFIDPHNKPCIWVYEKGNPKVRKSTAENIAVEKNYYTIKAPNENIDPYIFETALSQVESNAAPIFDKIKNRSELNAIERGRFAVFLAFTMTRVPNFRENIENALGAVMRKMEMILASDPEAFQASIESMEKETGEKLELPVEDYRQFVLSGKYTVKAQPIMSLRFVLLAKDLAPIFYKMNWTFFEASSDYKFITSDNPLSYNDPTHDPNSFYGIGLINKNIEVIFPISKDLLFFASWKRFNGYKKSNNKLVKAMTSRVAATASRYVFSSIKSDGINKVVQKYKDISPKMIVF